MQSLGAGMPCDMSVSGAGAAFKCRVLGLLCKVRSSGTACLVRYT